MHELSIAQNIIDIVNQTLSRDNWESVESVTIKIGKLFNILPEALRSSFNLLKEDYEFRNIHLEIEDIPLTLFCNNCNRTFTSDEFNFSCIYCRSNNLNVINGDILVISKITLRENK